MAPLPDNTTLTCPEHMKDFPEDSKKVVLSNAISDVFEIRSVLGRGRGLFARINIAQGQLIAAETPFFTLPSIANFNITPEDLLQKFFALSLTEQQQFRALHDRNAEAVPSLLGIVHTNALDIDSNLDGIFPNFSFLNHSCVPNAHYSWNGNLEKGTLYAIDDIKKGSEITMAYGGYQRGHWNFICSCETCASSSYELRRGDIKRARITTLQNEIIERAEIQHEGCLKDLREMKELLQDVYGNSTGAVLACVYFIASEVAASQSDLARSSVFAERAYGERLMCEGEDHPFVLKYGEVRDDLTLHYGFASTNFRETQVDTVPVVLGGEDFEDWLWTWE
ncbi:hypothetical protein WAI453_004291 [Rhynchosporium graminicola]